MIKEMPDEAELWLKAMGQEQEFGNKKKKKEEEKSPENMTEEEKKEKERADYLKARAEEYPYLTSSQLNYRRKRECNFEEWFKFNCL